MEYEKSKHSDNTTPLCECGCGLNIDGRQNKRFYNNIHRYRYHNRLKRVNEVSE